jgi:diguanylate cyclase (GGDEF)-like protein
MNEIALSCLRALVEALDSLNVAAYLLDESERAVLWNRSFMRLFPEHEAHMHPGEPYRENLRRFYEGRLQGDERAQIERYIEAGLERNRHQSQPFTFQHRGRSLRVASLALPGVGRIRLWRVQAEPAPGAPLPAGDSGLLDHIPDALMVADAELRILWVNQPFVVMYGLLDRAAALGRSFTDLYRDVWAAAAAEGGSDDGADGLALLAEHTRWAGAPFELALPGERCVRVSEQRSPDGRRVLAHVDVSAMKRQQRRLAEAEQQARASQALLAATLERMDQGVMMVSPQRIVEVCNRRAIELLGLPPELMAARPHFEQVLAWQWSQGEFADTPPDIQAFIRSGGILDQVQRYDRRRPDGRVIEVHSVPIEGGGVLRTYTDITERKHQEERIRHVARHDGLTALVNREVFLEHLAGAVDNPHRTADGFAVHYLDLNRFKPINDRLGHAVGDKVLAAVAARLRAAARDGDVVARLGGDEFAILQFGAGRPEPALGLARRVLGLLAAPMEIETHQLQVGAAIGIALCDAPGTDADTLMRQADAAMYAAKAGGRDRVRIHDHPPPAGDTLT